MCSVQMTFEILESTNEALSCPLGLVNSPTTDAIPKLIWTLNLRLWHLGEGQIAFDPNCFDSCISGGNIFTLTQLSKTRKGQPTRDRKLPLLIGDQ